MYLPKQINIFTQKCFYMLHLLSFCLSQTLQFIFDSFSLKLFSSNVAHKFIVQDNAKFTHLRPYLIGSKVERQKLLFTFLNELKYLTYRFCLNFAHNSVLMTMYYSSVFRGIIQQELAPGQKYSFTFLS